MTVRNAILGLLALSPRHGYELRAAFEAMMGGEEVWSVKPAQIYTTLARLEDSGLVLQEDIQQNGGPEKRIYALTPQGETALQEWFDTGVEATYQRDEFYIKLMLSLANEKVDPYRVIQAQRSRLYQELHDLTMQRNGLDAKREMARILLFDKAIMHIEADLRWVDMIDARLDDVRRHPPPAPEAKPRGRPKGS
jgi:DNA-binding PadR family transcriptional regulator